MSECCGICQIKERVWLGKDWDNGKELNGSSYGDDRICLNCFLKKQQNDPDREDKMAQLDIEVKVNQNKWVGKDIKWENIPEGTVVEITGEFKRMGAYNKITGQVKFEDGEEAMLSINDTSAAICSAKWGSDSLNWTGQQIMLHLVTIKNRKGCRLWKPA